MKKFSVLFAVAALVFASLACQTIMGGGNAVNMPDVPNNVPGGGDETSPTIPPVTTDNGNVTVGGDSPFPVMSDAFNLVSTSETVTYQTKATADDMTKFYRDELGKLGYNEKKDQTTTFGGIVAMFFEGNGKTIVLAGAPVGDGSLSVTLTYQQ